MILIRALCLLLVLAVFPACTKPTQVTTNYPTGTIVLPPGTTIDAQDVLIGPHGGALTRAGDFFLEAVFLPGGTVQLYAYNSLGEPIPVSNVHIDRISLNTNRGIVTVYLRPAETYYLVGYYDPLYYDPFFYGSYPYFYVLYPTVIVIGDIPSTVYRPPYRGVGSNPDAKGYPTKSPKKGYPTKSQPKGYPTNSTEVVAPAQKVKPQPSKGKGSSK